MAPVPVGLPPTPEEVLRDREALRSAVQARCAALASVLPGPSAGSEFEPVTWKWDRQCEDALYVVLINSQRMGAGCAIMSSVVGTC